MKIYTKTGDRGITSLYGGRRVPKNNIKVNAYGTVDELNSILGVVLTKISDKKIRKFIIQIQKDLFMVGGYLSGAEISVTNLSRRTSEMEELIDKLDKKLPPLKNFILPQGSESAAFLFYARSVARRTERKLVSLSQIEKIESGVLVYFNRLSDFLFMTARFLNNIAGFRETVWTV